MVWYITMWSQHDSSGCGVVYKIFQSKIQNQSIIDLYFTSSNTAHLSRSSVKIHPILHVLPKKNKKKIPCNYKFSAWLFSKITYMWYLSENQKYNKFVFYCILIMSLGFEGLRIFEKSYAKNNLNLKPSNHLFSKVIYWLLILRMIIKKLPILDYGKNIQNLTFKLKTTKGLKQLYWILYTLWS